MDKPSIYINPKSGSIKISGEVDRVDVDGNVIESLTNPKLCGCGLSKDKPWCDSSHGEYVKTVAQQLRAARELVKPCNLYGTTPVRALEIRENELAYRLEHGEVLVGVKFGGALDSKKKDEPTKINIFGYLTDAMQCVETLPSASMIWPRAEAEVVFKLSKEISAEIHPSKVFDYVSHVAAGMEIVDYRFGQVKAYLEDCIADNAGAAAFAHSAWIPATQEILDELNAEVLVNGVLIESAPLTVIQGNPWMAVVELSKVFAATGVKLAAGSIIFSGSATKGIPMVEGNNYTVNIEGIGSVNIKAS